MDKNDKQCPCCGETVTVTAKICRTCAYDFDTGTPWPEPPPFRPARNLAIACAGLAGLVIVLVAIVT